MMQMLNEWVDEPMPLLPLDHGHVFVVYRMPDEQSSLTEYRCVGCGRLAVDSEPHDSSTEGTQ